MWCSATSENNALSQSNAIQHYYGEIGIAAVAAAVRYQGDFKNAAYAPVATCRMARSPRLGSMILLLSPLAQRTKFIVAPKHCNFRCDRNGICRAKRTIRKR